MLNLMLILSLLLYKKQLIDSEKNVRSTTFIT